MELPMTGEVFCKHLKQRKHHDNFAENGCILMSKLEGLAIPKSTRGRTHGFVIPSLDTQTRTALLKLSYRRNWTAQINLKGAIIAGEHTYTYAHIELTGS
jgi:hypothetical protein